jgi:hypothetical protein
MTETYTIIDNFDKIKLAPYGVDTMEISHYRETIFPKKTKISNTDTFVQNYGAPYKFTSKNAYRYMPDMFRYITGRRFTTYGWYPLESQLATLGGYKQLKALEPTVENKPSFNYYFDLLYAPETIDINSKMFSNDLRFDQYYNPIALKTTMGFTTGINPFSLAPDLKNDITISDTLTALEAFKEKGTFNYTDDLRNNILFMGLSWLPPTKINTEALHGSHTEHMNTILLNSPKLQDILKKLLLFKIGHLLPTAGSGGQKGAGHGGDLKKADQDVWMPAASKHIYLVADLPKGTAKPAKEFDYVVNTDVVSIKSKYNYYAALAEQLPSNIQYEWQLPNLYTYYSLRTQKSEYYKNLVKLDQKKPVTPEEFSVYNYYETIQDSEVSIEGTDLNPGSIAPIPTAYRYKNIVVTDKNELNDANAVSKLFPMHNAITIPSKESGFMNLLKNKKRVNVFMTVLGNYFSGVRGGLSSEHTFALHNGTGNMATSTLQVFDIAQFFVSINSEYKLLKYFNDIKNVKFGAPDLLMPTVPLQQLGKWALSKSTNEIKEYLNKKALQISEIYEGKKCHSEVVAFEIAKFKMNSKGKKEHIQSIFLPSLHSGEDISYLDTQVFYGQEYIYEIFTHSLVVGSVYRIIRDGFNTEFNAKSEVATNIAPIQLPAVTDIPMATKAVIVRAPYYNNDSLLGEVDGVPEEKETTTVLDMPPMPPDVSFYPYKDKSNKILVLLNVNYGERAMTPVKIFAEDEEKIAAARDTQKKPSGSIIYKTDDAKGAYRIYRTQRKPANWGDFSDAQSHTVDSTTNTGYNDFIEMNTDYYYFARFTDVHGNISNPTAIFFIRIVKEGGFPPYLVTHTYDFSESQKIQTDRSFKKYIKIGLADGTRELINAAGGIQQVDLGYKKPGAADQLKKYKIRLTSKKTGKKIDINVDFAKTINTNYLDKVKEEAEILSDPNSLGSANYAEDIKKTEGALNNPDDTLAGQQVAIPDQASQMATEPIPPPSKNLD